QNGKNYLFDTASGGNQPRIRREYPAKPAGARQIREFFSELLERIALESNRVAIPGDHGERAKPLGQTKQSVFRQPEHA
ncbi:MAG: hypothetical protein ACREFU_07320, partial [Acetobacteraceae bacterium]